MNIHELATMVNLGNVRTILYTTSNPDYNINMRIKEVYICRNKL